MVGVCDGRGVMVGGVMVGGVMVGGWGGSQVQAIFTLVQVF